MPTYGYKCESCGNEFELLQKMSDPPIKVCPKCSAPVRKIMYAAGVIFKGSGYYSTDYKSSSKGSGSEGSSESSNGSPPSAEKAGGGDSKPAAEPKSESKPSTSDSSD